MKEDTVVQRAKDFFSRVAEYEGIARNNFISDIKMRHGDSYNGYQWPDEIRRARQDKFKPCLTMNMIRQHNLIISNGLRQSKSSVKCVASGGGATGESAELMRNCLRRIELLSRAQSAYTIARNWQIDGGIGWVRLVTEYTHEDSFDQDIRIKPVLDPLTIYIDPDCQQDDCSDAKQGLIFDTMPKKDFKKEFPKFADKASHSPLGSGTTFDTSVMKDYVAICEYFEVEMLEDTLLSFTHLGERKTIRASKLEGKMRKELLADKETKSRSIQQPVVNWYLIVNQEIVDQTVWPGDTIPLIPLFGEVTRIDGTLDRKGHTRAMLDAQRIYNYNASAEVQFGALQSKTPYMAPLAAIENHENIWNTANEQDYSVLPYNHMDDQGQPIPPPQRQQPPTGSPAFQAGMANALQQMMTTSGQYQNSLGQQGNERTGAAITGRQKQSDTATFHFEDNYEVFLISIATKLLQLIPKIYDTKRILQIDAEDGTEMEVEIDPAAQQVYLEKLSHDQQVAKRILNPQIGRYAIAPSVGPAYGAKREETVQALATIVTQNPQLTGIVGDILLGSMDFDKSQEAAQRLKRMVPPMALGKGPSQEEQQLQSQVASLHDQIASLLELQGKASLKLVGKAELRDIGAYEAETKRMVALQKALPLDQDGLKKMVQQLMQEAGSSPLAAIEKRNEEDIATTDQAPHPALGAQQAPDGEYYIKDPVRKGKFIKVTPRPPPPPEALGAQQAPDGEYYLQDPTRRGKFMRISPLVKKH